MPRTATRGFTLIEVSLAIVIGVIIMTSTFYIYQNARRSTGNSRAQIRATDCASLVEEIAAMNNYVYPPLEDVRKVWNERREEDAGKSPWGGSLPQAGGSFQSIVNLYTMANNSVGDCMTDAAWQAGWPALQGWTTTQQASAGQLVYFTGTGTSSVYDTVGQVMRSPNRYVVGYCDTDGSGPAFLVGGH